MATLRDCDKIRPLLSDYAGGELGDAEAWQVKMHLSSCAVCAKVTNDFTATTRLLHTLPQMQPSANFEVMLAKRLADDVLKLAPKSWLVSLQERALDWWRLPGVRPAFAAGTMLAVLAPVALFSIHPTTPPVIAVTKATPTAAPTKGEGIKGETVTESDTLSELWREHDAYASAEPFGDRANALTAAETSPSL